ncbi:hypothetical protein [Solibacillus daqui]|uniref:hypothetical protein n=1 Tax=Solibacillus daqui TaxID=2912187 RepID=UPI0023654D04|nr:hypothetical protein [Solibacillus daqui]
MVQIEDWLLAIDIENTKMAVEFNSYLCMSEECRNFVEACENHMGPVVLEFANKLGIDLAKPSQLESLQVNNNTAVMYSGKYHIIGEVIEGELDAWDIVLDTHCFSLTSEFDMVPIVMIGSIIEISFEVVLPWVLEVKMEV